MNRVHARDDLDGNEKALVQGLAIDRQRIDLIEPVALDCKSAPSPTTTSDTDADDLSATIERPPFALDPHQSSPDLQYEVVAAMFVKRPEYRNPEPRGVEGYARLGDVPLLVWTASPHVAIVAPGA